MNDALFEWDEANIGHVAKHGVTPKEAEEVVLGDTIEIGLEVLDGEERSSHIGETTEGRILRVVLTFRGERMRVITAFEPDKYWKIFYLEQKAEWQ